jgi:Na+/serine symporter
MYHNRWRCVVISALTFLVDVAVNAMTGVWRKLRNSDNCWYSCLKDSLGADAYFDKKKQADNILVEMYHKSTHVEVAEFDVLLQPAL